MLMLMTILACGDKTTDTSVQETADEPGDTAETAETDTPPPFAPMNGHWTYSGGELIPEGTTCQLDETTQGELTDPVGFSLTSTDDGFVVLADDAEAGDNGTACAMLDPDSPDAGGFMCANASTEVTFEDIDMVIVTADIQMGIDTTTTGVFTDASSLTNTFTLTLDCLDVSHDLGGSCGDITEFFPTPCTIQFTANATHDQ